MRYVWVPINKEAMERLNYDQCIDGDLIELILDNDSFDMLWEIGLFTDINWKIGTLIDDYEDDGITDIDCLMQVKEIIEEYALENKNVPVFSDLIKLVDAAIKNKTGIFFFFFGNG